MYRWRHNGIPVSNGAGGSASGGGTVSGATTGTLVITGVQVADTGDYVCAVSAGCHGDVSNPAALTIAAYDMCTPSTVAYWSFDETPSDSCGHAQYNGSFVGTAAIDPDTRAPTFGNRGSLRLNGNSSRINLAAPFPVGPLSQGTLEAWVYLESSQGGVILNHGTAALHTDIAASIYPPQSAGRPYRALAWIDDHGPSPIEIPGFQLSQWHHLAWTWSGTKHQYFLDGKLVIEVASTWYPKFTGNEAEIGSDDQEVGYFVGRLDEVKLSNRVLAWYELSGGCFACPADFDGNGFVNGEDFDAFAFEFFWGTQAADFDRNGFVNGEDFDAFALHFAAGC